jgi:anti-anti-sigma factor
MQPVSTSISGTRETLPRCASKESKLKISLETRRSGQVIVLHCEGRIVYRDESAALSRVVGESLQHTKEIVLDLAGVTTIDSAGLGELVRLHRSAESNGNLMKLACPNPRVRALLDLTNLSSVLEIYPALEDALDTGDERTRLV